MSLQQPPCRLKNRTILAPYKDFMCLFLISTCSLRLLSLLWLILPPISFCWSWSFAEMESIGILLCIWRPSMLPHASAIVLFHCYVEFHCVNTPHIFLLCHWWIFGLFYSLWPFWIKQLWLFLHMCFGTYIFPPLGNVPRSRIALVHTAK